MGYFEIARHPLNPVGGLMEAAGIAGLGIASGFDKVKDWFTGKKQSTINTVTNAADKVVHSDKVAQSSSTGHLLNNIGQSFSNTANALSGKVSNAANSILAQAYSTSAIKNAEADQQRILDYNSVEAEKQRQAQRDENERNRQFNSEEAEKQRNYETEMSNTAFQRAVTDLKAAGINPLYAANIGGATTPSGTSASYSGSVSGQASAGYYDYSKAKESDLHSLSKDVFGDLFSDLLSNVTKANIVDSQNATARTVALINGASNLASTLFRGKVGTRVRS